MMLTEINEIFKSVFEDDGMVVTKETSARDISSWNSLNHVILISEIEKKFGVSFELDEMIGFSNVGDILRCIESKRNP